MARAVSVAENLAHVRDRITSAGGDADHIRIVAVTKGQPVAAVREAVAAGIDDIGENYAQELVAKIEALDASGSEPSTVRWHFIGQLQRNKVRTIAPDIALWQSVDRLTLANEIARRAPGAAVLIEVNLTDDAARGGARPELVPGIVEGARDLGLDVRGLMAVGPPGGPEAARTGFGVVRDLADRLGLPERSLGMSGDLEIAVQAGTTMVRVGTALFGERPRVARKAVEN
jgi:pyridoxal phosphate enzyme (YggS family)